MNERKAQVITVVVIMVLAFMAAYLATRFVFWLRIAFLESIIPLPHYLG